VYLREADWRESMARDGRENFDHHYSLISGAFFKKDRERNDCDQNMLNIRLDSEASLKVGFIMSHFCKPHRNESYLITGCQRKKFYYIYVLYHMNTMYNYGYVRDNQRVALLSHVT